ncbi:hypothetical protein BDY21DRAFT_333355 [Lineolata rhizophorae]|uniref:proline--tRNA ligase n=1 Tax=Lineolata rhizophorae TaxID=578093 RepID=A0A6A6PAD6_9PEZI|nr:hypothetical protein BDY21DRAFT_333355 [Lineolata rhizophorae]
MSARPSVRLCGRRALPTSIHSRAAIRILNARSTRGLHDDRYRLSTFWAPTGGISESPSHDESHSLLLRAGFLRPAHPGFFQLLPLGLRVQEKIERLIDKHMRRIGASKVSLSSVSSEALWRRSGRLDAVSNELLRINEGKAGGKDSDLILSPTHEEEITELVRALVKSYRDLPLRLYQMSRKYRNERRVRQGLLRAKEFLMKDLYTFDTTPETALQTYSAVRGAYDSIFSELQIPYLVAEADSGSMGGKLSHEYHLQSEHGEDTLFNCNSCGYVANEEVVQSAPDATAFKADNPNMRISTWKGVSKDRSALIVVHFPILPHHDPTVPPDLGAVKHVLPTLDTAVESTLAERHFLAANPTISTAQELSKQALSSQSSTSTSKPTIIQLIDHRIPEPQRTLIKTPYPTSSITNTTVLSDTIPNPDLTRLQPGDPCPRCHSPGLRTMRAIEVGHTFHLGTRYSKPLDLAVALPRTARTAVVMGCHGIGVSRLIGAVAAVGAKDGALFWPRVVAPFEVVVLAGDNEGSKRLSTEVGGDMVTEKMKAEEIYDGLVNAGIDAILDDRSGKGLGWKKKDAKLVGYPVAVAVGGKAWHESRGEMVEVLRNGKAKEVAIGEIGNMTLRILNG